MFSKCCQTNLTRNKQNLSIILLLIGIHFLILFPSFAQTNKTNISQNIQKLLQNCDQFKSVNFETLEEAILSDPIILETLDRRTLTIPLD